jgi:hypothetical protein
MSYQQCCFETGGNAIMPIRFFQILMKRDEKPSLVRQSNGGESKKEMVANSDY